MAAKKSSSTSKIVEWVAGSAFMPDDVTDEGEPYRPELLVWMSAEGLILGAKIARPGTLVPQAAALLRETIAKPLVGPAHAPHRIRTTSPELAEALRDAVAGIAIVQGPTPEIDAMLEAMVRSFARDGEGPTTYLTEGVSEPAVAALFRAAAELHRAAAWKVVPPDEALSFSIDALGIDRMAVTTLGHEGVAFGLLVFQDASDFQAFLEVAGEVVDATGGMPPHLALHIGPRHELPEALAAEVAEHRWELADADAIPWPVTVDEELVPRPMTADELFVCEAVALAIAELARSTPDLARAWQGGDPVTRTITVATHQGSLDVRLLAPAEEAASEGGPMGILDALDLLEETDEDLDLTVVDALSRQLVAEFRASPEGQSLPGGASWAELVMDLGARHFDATIASLGPEELREIVEELVPRKVVGPANAMTGLEDELRAFYAFLGREHGLEQAEECVRVLGSMRKARSPRR